MFVCPKCGYKDSSIWKGCKWRLYSVYCNTTELEQFRPDLIEKLKKDPWVKDGPYWYKITKNGKIVYRMTEIGKSEFKTHGFTEKPKDPFQRKLFDPIWMAGTPRRGVVPVNSGSCAASE